MFCISLYPLRGLIPLLQPSAAQKGDDLALRLGERDAAKVAAILGLGAVIAQHKDVALGNLAGLSRNFAAPRSTAPSS